MFFQNITIQNNFQAYFGQYHFKVEIEIVFLNHEEVLLLLIHLGSFKPTNV